MKSEIHLFIIWSAAIKVADDILGEIEKSFDILDVYIIQWSQKHFSQNMSRFYGTNLPDGSFKERHCGRGPFCLIVVQDNSPSYDHRLTSAGLKWVNINMFDAKQRCRDLTGGGHRVHGTNTPAETDHDLMLLLEQKAADFPAASAKSWDGRVKFAGRDLPGCDGWQSMAQFFRVLNATTPYVVLRNFEGLPEHYTLENHGDIDLLCSSMEDMRFITNAQPIFADKWRVLHKVTIGSQDVLFDFRHVGDMYYDQGWEADIIRRRVFSNGGFYRPGNFDYFYSLLYHAMVHKPGIAQDYVNRLCVLSSGITVLTPIDFKAPHQVKSLLDNFLAEHGYDYTDPLDLSVYVNTEMTGALKLSLERIILSSSTIGKALCRLFKQARDCSTESEDFADRGFRINKVLQRHFSPRRYATIDALPLKGIGSVLEIGCESGVVTRYLGERFDRVFAVEENPDLARALELRCRDLPTVTVIQSSPLEIDLEETVDLIVFNCDWKKWVNQGATLSTLGETLCRSIDFLAPNGVLLFSIDNPNSKIVHTYSSEIPSGNNGNANGVMQALDVKYLIALLETRGLSYNLKLNIFPDNLLPGVIFTAEAVRRRLQSFGYWAASVSADNGESCVDLVAAGEMAKAGLLGKNAGGFCILATRAAKALPDIPWQILGFSSLLRPSQTQTITSIYSGDNLTVHKNGQCLKSPVFIFNPVAKSPLFEGHLMDAAFIEAAQAGSHNLLIDLLGKVALFLKARFTWQNNDETFPKLTVAGDVLLDGSALDSVPRNLMLKDNELFVFDLEWSATIPLPLSFMLSRCLVSMHRVIPPDQLIKVLQPGRSDKMDSFSDAIVALLNQLGLFAPLSNDILKIFFQFDQRFLSFAFTGILPEDNPSLLELYQKVVFYHASKDKYKMVGAIRELQLHYPAHPKVIQLISSLQGSLPDDRNSGARILSDIIKPHMTAEIRQ